MARNLPLRNFVSAVRRLDSRRIFLLLAASLSSTILLKVADIQYLELIYLLQLCVLVLLFPRHRFHLRLFRPGHRFQGASLRLIGHGVGFINPHVRR